MEKKELKQFLSARFKELGFEKKKDYYTKMLTDDYLIGCCLDPSSYTKGYQFYCGMIYLPNEMKMPFRGLFDLEWTFRFPIKPDDEFDFDKGPYTYIFEYEQYTIEQFERIFEKNYKHYMEPLYSEEYGLEILRKDWRLMRRHSFQTIEGLCKRAGIEYSAVIEFLQNS